MGRITGLIYLFRLAPGSNESLEDNCSKDSVRWMIIFQIEIRNVNPSNPA